MSAETRGLLLATARRCFGEHGYAGTSTRLIVEEAGLTVGALYYYFDGKHDLYAAVLAEASATIVQRLEAAADGVPGFGPRLARALDEAVRMHREDPSLAAFVSMLPIELGRHPELQDEVSTIALSIYMFFRRLAQDAAETDGLVRDIDHVATMALGLMMGFSLLAKLVPDVSAYEGAAEAFHDLVQGELTPKARRRR